MCNKGGFVRSLLPIFVFLFFSLFPQAHVTETYAADIGLEAGKQAPPVELPDLAGNTLSLSQLKGTVVLLNFWSTLCKPCIAEMPSLNSLYGALKDNGLKVIAVSIDGSDKPVREFASQKKIAFTILLDTEKEVFFDQYAGPSLPATYLIDRNGIIVETFNGPWEWDSPEMKSKIVKLLKDR